MVAGCFKEGIIWLGKHLAPVILAGVWFVASKEGMAENKDLSKVTNAVAQEKVWDLGKK